MRSYKDLKVNLIFHIKNSKFKKNRLDWFLVHLQH